MVIAGIDPDPEGSPLRAWELGYWEAVHPHDPGGAYVNFMSDDEVEGCVRASYGENYDRAGGPEAEVRPGEPLPGEPEHQAGRVALR
jgi:hypothetical protein